MHCFNEIRTPRARPGPRYFFSSRQAGSSTLFDGSFGEIALRTTNPLLGISGKVSRIDVGSPKSMVSGGAPPALSLERTRDTRGAQKLISNTRPEAGALSSSPEGGPFWRAPAPETRCSAFALLKTGAGAGREQQKAMYIYSQ